MKRVSQKEAIFYKLYNNFKDKNELIPVFAFMGEQYVPESGKWGYVSYEVSARFSEMFKENPGLIERKEIIGKSGARYYGYRLSPAANPELIRDPRLRGFYMMLKRARTPVGV